MEVITLKNWKRVNALLAGIVLLAIFLVATGCSDNLNSGFFEEKNVGIPDTAYLIIINMWMILHEFSGPSVNHCPIQKPLSVPD